jgi:hypothetical protein
MDADGDRTGVNVVLPDDDTNTGGNSDNTGGNSDGTDDTNTDDDGENNNSNVTVCGDGVASPCNVTPPVDDGSDTSGESESAAGEDTQQKTKLMLFAIIAVIGIGLYVFGKGGSDELDLAGEARIEKIWDETELEESEVTPFIPAPPPMAKMESKSEEE